MFFASNRKWKHSYIDNIVIWNWATAWMEYIIYIYTVYIYYAFYIIRCGNLCVQQRFNFISSRCWLHSWFLFQMGPLLFTPFMCLLFFLFCFLSVAIGTICCCCVIIIRNVAFSTIWMYMFLLSNLSDFCLLSILCVCVVLCTYFVIAP